MYGFVFVEFQLFRVGVTKQNNRILVGGLSFDKL
jgi:hypothetical protein